MKEVNVTRNDDKTFEVKVILKPSYKVLDRIEGLPCKRSAYLLAHYFCVKNDLRGYTTYP